ncbi:MAG: division/cell wall cluster transcriptional repressor MraZ [Gammaproteobacteria bacterium]|nr:division/cell wall cluster transcriptional repressor MraZ [Gammaproteobacteria bacterium]MDE0224533.1 division/cell wall cluster transcriptional repressor MraZ [Gammaproteobacteria bacterium]
MFRGSNSVTLDARGRMALPARFRQVVLERFDGQVVVTIDLHERCLLLYPLPEWEEIESSLQSLANMRPAARAIQRLLIGHATDVQLDGHGRVLLPPTLREFAGLEKRLIVFGIGRKIEIWSEERWREREENSRSMASEVTSELTESAGLDALSI